MAVPADKIAITICGDGGCGRLKLSVLLLFRGCVVEGWIDTTAYLKYPTAYHKVIASQ